MRLATASLLVVAIVAGACKRRDANKIDMTVPKMSVSDDVKRLQAFLTLPVPPNGVRWLKETQRGGNDFSVTAVLSYGPEAIAHILKGSLPFDLQPVVRISRETALALLPQSMHNALGDGEAVALHGVAVQPNLFVNPEKSSLIHGRAMVMKSEGIVFVSLFTM